MMVKKFTKFMKSRNIAFEFAGNSRGGKRNGKVATFTCYECGKEGHIEPDYTNLKLKQKADEKYNQDRRKIMQRKAYITWEDYDSGGSSSDEDNQSLKEEKNLCLMAGSINSLSNNNNFKDEYTAEEEEVVGSSSTPFRPRSGFEKHMVRQMRSLTILCQSLNQDVATIKGKLQSDEFDYDSGENEEDEEESVADENDDHILLRDMI